MADRKITMFELHFDGGFQVGPKSIGSGEEADTEEDEGVGIDVGGGDETAGGGRGRALRLGLLAGLVGLTLALVLRKVLGGEGVEPDFDEVDVEA